MLPLWPGQLSRQEVWTSVSQDVGLGRIFPEGWEQQWIFFGQPKSFPGLIEHRLRETRLTEHRKSAKRLLEQVLNIQES